MPHLVSIVLKSSEMEDKPADFFSRKTVERATLARKQGIVGDLKGNSGKRQLNVMFAEIVADLASEGFQTAPGLLGEQLVIVGIPSDSQASGVQLQIGESAVISIDFLRTGCSRFEHIQGRSRTSAIGRLGYMARVLVGGEIAVGDPVVVFSSSDGQTQQSLFEMQRE